MDYVWAGYLITIGVTFAYVVRVLRRERKLNEFFKGRST